MEKDNKLKNKNVETYTDDMVKAIESDKGGLIKKIIHEEEEHEAVKKNLSPSSKKNKLFMLVSILLVFLALFILLFLTFLNKNVAVVPVAPQSTSIIFTDQTDFEPIDGFTKDQIIGTVLNQVNNNNLKIGGIDGIYLTENNKVTGFKRFNTLIKSNLVLSQPNLISDSFLLGSFNSGLKSNIPGAGDLFILLKVSSFTDVFPTMLGWENKILSDLGGFFKVNASSENNYLFTKNWEDGFVGNKNARILKDKDGKIVLMYVFVDDNSIVITNSENAVNEIILRLGSSKVKK